METPNIHIDLQGEGHFTKTIIQTKIEVDFRFKPYNVLKENGLPVISHVHVRYTNLVTGKWGGKSHYFNPESLTKYQSFPEFAEDVINIFTTDGTIIIEKDTQYSLF